MGLTAITPYWLNKRGSPSSRTVKFCLFPKLSHVARSLKVYASTAAAMFSVAPIPDPISRYQLPSNPEGSCPTSDHRRRSAIWVPLLSPREIKTAPWAIICMSAALASFSPLIWAGSVSGPTSTKSLYITSNRFTPQPSATKPSSAALECTSNMSPSPLAAFFNA